MCFVILMFRLAFLLCLVTGPVLTDDCVQSTYCHCVIKDLFHDLYCQMNCPYLEVTGNNTVFRRFYISAGKNCSRMESRFKNLHVNHVFITGSNVPDLDCHLLRGLTGLSSVDIIDTKLSRIPTCTLHENTNITSLSIINSQINELPRRAFAVLPNIKRIVLSHNCLTHIRLDTFYGVDHLTSLDLSYNCLSGSFTTGSLSHLTQLTYLNLSHNNVSSLNVAFLDYLSAPVVSDLSFSNLTRCHMNFAWNHIKRIARFHFHVRPSKHGHISIEVDLSHNELEILPEMSLDEPIHSSISIDLIITSNQVSLFDRDPLRCNFCPNVILRLSIAHNRLTSFPVCHANIIYKYNSQLFNFSHNLIDGSVNRLCGAEDLHILDVSSNRLTAVGELGFKGKPSRIRELYMAGNLISEIKESEMNNIVGTLKIVDFTNNSLFDYQQIIDSFPTTLSQISLAQNPFDCTLTNFTLGNGTLCLSSDIFYGARCAQPTKYRGTQILCLPSLSCSNLISCSTDKYMELSLNSTTINGAITLRWEVIGPGKDKLSEFLLTVINTHLNKTRIDLFLHRSSRNFTVQPISPNTRYTCCIESFIFNISTEKSCYYVETGDDIITEQVGPTVLVVGVTIGIMGILVGIVLPAWWFIKKRNSSARPTGPKQIYYEQTRPRLDQEEEEDSIENQKNTTSHESAVLENESSHTTIPKVSNTTIPKSKRAENGIYMKHNLIKPQTDPKESDYDTIPVIGGNMDLKDVKQNDETNAFQKPPELPPRRYAEQQRDNEHLPKHCDSPYEKLMAELSSKARRRNEQNTYYVPEHPKVATCDRFSGADSVSSDKKCPSTYGEPNNGFEGESDI